MKYLLLPILVSIFNIALNGQHYLTEIFDTVDIITDIDYAENYSIITGVPEVRTLHADIYQPIGDVTTARPLVILVHGGFFLPVPANGRTTGAKDDYAIVEICTRLAKMGYVTAAIEFRQGWNPIAPTTMEQRNQLLNATYRGMQDLRTFVRFVNMQVESGNPWNIDPAKIAVWGQGSGGFISLMGATIDEHSDFNLPIFSCPTCEPFIDSTLVGNIYGTNDAAINLPNHVGYSSDFQFAFNTGGALFDTSWIEANSIPIAAAHSRTNPHSPFGISPITGMVACEMGFYFFAAPIPIIPVAGPKCVLLYSNSLGINDDLMCLDDETTLNLQNQGFAEPNLWAIHRPQVEAAPWEYWDANYWDSIPHPSGGTFHTIALLTNPDMSIEKANRYIDTLLWFFTPRACIALDLGCQVTECIVNAKGINKASLPDLEITPNPATEKIRFYSEGNEILEIQIFDLNGHQIRSLSNLYANAVEIPKSSTVPGLYIAKIRFKEGIVVKKFVFL